MSDTDPTPYRNMASTLWAAVTRDVQGAVDRLTSLRRVQSVEDDGRVTVIWTDPNKPAPQAMARLRGSTFAEGDDVVTIRVAGHDIAIGTVALPGDAVAAGGDPTAVLDGVLTDLGYQTPLVTQEVAIFVPLTVKYQGVTTTMTTKEQLLAHKFAGEFSGLIDAFSLGGLRVHTRVVYRTELLDIDAWSAAHGGDGPAVFGNGRYVHEGISRSLLTDEYGGIDYDGRIGIFSSRAVQAYAFGLTNGYAGWSFVNINDAYYDGPLHQRNNVIEGVVHEYLHQLEAKSYSAGYPVAQGLDSSGGYSPDDQRGYTDWYTRFLTDPAYVRLSAIATKGPVANPDPRMVAVPRRPVDPNNGWDLVPQRRIDFNAAGGSLVKRYPDRVEAGTGVTFTAIGEGVRVDVTGGSGGTVGPPGPSGLLTATDSPSIDLTYDANAKDITAVAKFGSRTGTSNDLIPRNSETQQRFDINQVTTLVLNNPDHFRIESGLTATVDGGGVRIMVDAEFIQDIVAALIAAGTGLTKVYDDAGNLLTIAVSPDVTQATNLRNVALVGYDSTNLQRYALNPSGTLFLYDAGGNNTVTLYSGIASRFSLTPTVGPSGSAVPVSLVGHTHTAASITDFTEAAQDAVAAMLASGTGVTLAYDDAANTLTITGTAGGGGGATDPEIVRDTIGVALIGAGLVAVTVNDTADTITLSTTATANSTDAQLRDRTTHTGAQAIATVTGLQGAIDAKAPLASPAFTGTPIAPTSAAGTNTTQIATTAFVLANAPPSAFQQFYGSNDWINTALSLGATNVAYVAVAIPANTLVGVPIRLSAARLVNGLSVYVSAAATGNVRFSLAQFNATGTAATILANSGTVSPSTTGAKTLTISASVPPGWYELFIHSDVAISVSGLPNSAFLTTPWDGLGQGLEGIAVGGTIARKLVYSVAQAFTTAASGAITIGGAQMTTGAVPMINLRSTVP